MGVVLRVSFEHHVFGVRSLGIRFLAMAATVLVFLGKVIFPVGSSSSPGQSSTLLELFPSEFSIVNLKIKVWTQLELWLEFSLDPTYFRVFNISDFFMIWDLNAGSPESMSFKIMETWKWILESKVESGLETVSKLSPESSVEFYSSRTQVEISPFYTVFVWFSDWAVEDSFDLGMNGWFWIG